MNKMMNLGNKRQKHQILTKLSIQILISPTQVDLVAVPTPPMTL